MNSVSLIGRLGQDPELRYTQNGTSVCNLSIAVADNYGDTKQTYWFRATCWQKLAEACAQYTHKGSQIGITGKLITRSWKTNSGEDRVSTEIMASTVDFLDPKPDQAVPREEPSSSGPSVPPMEDDVPF